jgi:hypothetical protein
MWVSADAVFSSANKGVIRLGEGVNVPCAAWPDASLPPTGGYASGGSALDGAMIKATDKRSSAVPIKTFPAFMSISLEVTCGYR